MKVENLQRVRAKMLRQNHVAKLPPHKTLVSRPHAELPRRSEVDGHHGTQLRGKVGAGKQMELPNSIGLDRFSHGG